jgi:hypothetical protein
MRVDKRRLLIPGAVILGLFVQAMPSATATTAPLAQKITGVVETVVREPSPGQRTVIGQLAAMKSTTKALRVGTKLVPLTVDSLSTTKDGATVSVSVVPSSDGQKRVVSASMISAPVASAVSPIHQVYLALVLPTGIAPDPTITDASARAMVTKASQFWSSQTGGKVSFNTARVLAPYHSAYACEDTYSMWNEAMALMPEASGAGKHLIVVAPTGAAGCAYGLGTVGGIQASGNEVFVSGLNQSLMSHELGHNLGLNHSNSLRCTGAQDKPRVGLLFPGCTPQEYNDLFDVMGYSGTNFGEGNLNAVHLDGMNLLPGAVRKILSNSGVTTIKIPPLSTALTTATINRTLKITDPNGSRYYVQYRTRSGRDRAGALTGYSPAWGVQLLRDNPSVPASSGSYELDATPTSLSFDDYNRSLRVGQTFTAASKKVSIKVVSQDSTGATLIISNWSSAIVPYRATLALPTQAPVGSAITATTKVTDLHGRSVGNWAVTLQKLPRGATSWMLVKTLRTTSVGVASYRFANGASGYYRWVTSGAAGAPTRVSPAVAVISSR